MTRLQAVRDAVAKKLRLAPGAVTSDQILEHVLDTGTGRAIVAEIRADAPADDAQARERRDLFSELQVARSVLIARSQGDAVRRDDLAKLRDAARAIFDKRQVELDELDREREAFCACTGDWISKTTSRLEETALPCTTEYAASQGARSSYVAEWVRVHEFADAPRAAAARAAVDELTAVAVAAVELTLEPCSLYEAERGIKRLRSRASKAERALAAATPDAPAPDA